MLDIGTTNFQPDVLYVIDGFLQENTHTKYHYHKFLEISIILQGPTTYSLDNTLHHLDTGDVIFINPDMMHNEIQNTGHSHHLHIGIDHLQFTGYNPNTFPLTDPIIHLSEHPEFQKIIFDILKEKEEQQPYQELAFQQLVMTLWVYLLRQITQHKLSITPVKPMISSKKDMATSIKYYLETHHSEEISLDSLSNSMYVSPTYISKLFKEETGESPINYLISVRMKRAKELLSQQQLTIKEVSEAVGYQDAYHFSKLFKKYTGISPREYSKQKELKS